MADGSVYIVTELVGTSTESWEDAARVALKTAAKSLRDLRIAEIVKQDIVIDDDGSIALFRVRLNVSFRYDKD
ncbi:MAG TPA: dodecin family protein [Miltoncostaeaceae bacterium]|nr:dodecin family protein [Miltoncostaeaceae bacterium]